MVEDVEDFDLEGFEVWGSWFSGGGPGFDEAVADARGNRSGQGAGDGAEVLLADEVDRLHDGGGDLESGDDSGDRFEMGWVEAEGLGGDVSESDGVAKELTVSETDEHGIARLHFGGGQVGVNGVGSTRAGVESHVYDPEGIHWFSLQCEVKCEEEFGERCNLTGAGSSYVMGTVL